MTVRKLLGQTSSEMRDMFGRWYLKPLGEWALGLGTAGRSRKPRAPKESAVSAALEEHGIDDRLDAGPSTQPTIAIEAVYLAVALLPQIELKLVPSPDLSWPWRLVSHPSNPLFLTPPEGYATWDDAFSAQLVAQRFGPHDSLDPSTLHTAFASYCKESRSARNTLTDAFAPVLRVIRGAPEVWNRESNWVPKIEHVGVTLHPELEDRWDEPAPSDPIRTIAISVLIQAIGAGPRRTIGTGSERDRLERILTAAEAWLEAPDPVTEAALQTLLKAE